MKIEKTAGNTRIPNFGLRVRWNANANQENDEVKKINYWQIWEETYCRVNGCANVDYYLPNEAWDFALDLPKIFESRHAAAARTKNILWMVNAKIVYKLLRSHASLLPPPVSCVNNAGWGDRIHRSGGGRMCARNATFLFSLTRSGILIYWRRIQTENHQKILLWTVIYKVIATKMKIIIFTQLTNVCSVWMKIFVFVFPFLLLLSSRQGLQPMGPSSPSIQVKFMMQQIASARGNRLRAVCTQTSIVPSLLLALIVISTRRAARMCFGTFGRCTLMAHLTATTGTLRLKPVPASRNEEAKHEMGKRRKKAPNMRSSTPEAQPEKNERNKSKVFHIEFRWSDCHLRNARAPGLLVESALSGDIIVLFFAP